MGRNQRREAAGGVATIAMVDARSQRTVHEVLALRVVALRTPFARRGDAARATRQPGVEHDALTHPALPHPRPDRGNVPYHLMPEHLRKRDDRSHRAVVTPLQENLLVIAAAQAAQCRAYRDPLRARRR